jgi:hypothetical protein
VVSLSSLFPLPLPLSSFLIFFFGLHFFPFLHFLTFYLSTSQSNFQSFLQFPSSFPYFFPFSFSKFHLLSY